MPGEPEPSRASGDLVIGSESSLSSVLVTMK